MDDRLKTWINFALVSLGGAAGWLCAVWWLYPLRPPVLRALLRAANATPDHMALWAGCLAGAVAGAALAVWLDRRSSHDLPQRFHRFLRGTRSTSVRALARRTRERGARQVFIGKLPMPTRVENRNLLVAGSVGTGKSVCIKGMIGHLLQRHDRMVVVDPDGDYLSKFYLPGDVILNPFDERGAGWSIFNELWQPYDYDEYAKSVIPESGSADGEEWAGYARVLFAETARALALRGQGDTDALVDHLTRVPFEVLKPMLAHTAAAPLFAADAERARGSVRFILSRYLTPHQYLRPGDFSLRRWLSDPDAGNLFITWRAGMLESLRPLISTWTDVLCKAILATTEDEDRRMWFFLDELAALQLLPSLPSAATIGRKHGLRIVAGLQSVSQLKKIYGDAGAIELRACFRSQLVFGGATTDAETAEEMSLGLGEHEVERIQRSHSRGGNGYSVSTSREIVRERVVLPSQITSMKDLTGVVKFAGDYPIAKVRLVPRNYPLRTQGLVLR